MQCITLEDLSMLSNHSQGDYADSISPSGVNKLPANEIPVATATTAAAAAAALSNDEPIYAVIDLREKYLKRQEKLNKQAENRDTSSPSSSAASTSTSSSPANVCITAEGDAVEKPPSPGYATIIGRGGDHNNNCQVDGNGIIGDRLGDERILLESSKIRSPYHDHHQPRPKSFQLYSSAATDDYEEVKLDNQIFMRDFLYLSK